MPSVDPIADLFSQIRNAIAVSRTEINLPHSKTKETVAKLLADNGYLVSAGAEGDGKAKRLHVVINETSRPAKISSLKRLSTPGRRLYSAASDIPKVKNGRGLVIISTSKGMMSGQEAKDQNVGGELICEVY